MDDYPVLPRLAQMKFQSALGVHPVVIVMGARQTGKSTLVRTLAASENRLHLTLDDLNVRGQARTSPDELVRRSSLLALDEVQREPDLILSIKRVVDDQRPRKRGQFILTGSANLLLMRRVSETLAGRAGYIHLWPLTRRERLGLGTAGIWSQLLAAPPKDWLDLVQSQTVRREDWQKIAHLGGYPTPALELDAENTRAIWHQGYVQSYLERDLQDLSAIDNLIDFQRLMRATCLRIGSMANLTELSRDTGIPRPTVHRYLNLLETSYQLVRVEPYSVNRTKRLIKAPKLYWSDTGLALYLSGVAEPGGAYLENLVLNDLVAWRDAQTPRPNVLYWRTSVGHEVDFVIEHKDHLLPLEIKATAKPTPTDAQHLVTFREEYSDKVRGSLLLHTGTQAFWIAKDVLAAPWWKVI